jgi:hypothetical protein
MYELCKGLLTRCLWSIIKLPEQYDLVFVGVILILNTSVLLLFHNFLCQTLLSIKSGMWRPRAITTMLMGVMANIYGVFCTLHICFGIVFMSLSYYSLWNITSWWWVAPFTHWTVFAFNKFSINDAWNNLVGKAEILKCLNNKTPLRRNNEPILIAPLWQV